MAKRKSACTGKKKAVKRKTKKRVSKRKSFLERLLAD